MVKIGFKHSPESIQKIIDNNGAKGKPAWNRGISPSLETRRKISLAQVGKKRGHHSEETKKKIGDKLRGLKRSDEIKKKCRDAQIKRFGGIRSKEDIKKYKQSWYQSHKELTKERTRIRAITHKEEIKKKAHEHYLKNKKRFLEYRKQWKNKNIERVRENHRIKMETDIQYKLRYVLRLRLNCALRGKAKSGSAIKDLGCSIDEFVKHIESKFVDGMSWNNHGEWHLDHIMPLSSFDLENREELLKACNFTNIQPLWAFDNLSKGDKIPQMAIA